MELYVAGNPTPYCQNVNGALSIGAGMLELVFLVSWHDTVLTFVKDMANDRNDEMNL